MGANGWIGGDGLSEEDMRAYFGSLRIYLEKVGYWLHEGLERNGEIW